MLDDALQAHMLNVNGIIIQRAVGSILREINFISGLTGYSFHEHFLLSVDSFQEK